MPRLLLTALLISFIGIANAYQCPRPIIVGWEPWEPYLKPPHTGSTPTGLDSDILTPALAHMGCQLEWRELTWKVLLRNIEVGRIDMATGASKTSEREAYAYFSEPFRSETVSLFVRHGEAEKFIMSGIGDIIDLNFTLGIVPEYYYGENFAHLQTSTRFQKQLQAVKSDRRNIEKLLLGRIDGFLADPFSIVYIAQLDGIANKLAQHSLPIHEDDVHFMISRESLNEEFIAALNDSLRQMRSRGQLQQIIESYRDL